MVSAGGNVVLLYASKYKDIHIVVNISGRFNLARGMEGRLDKNFIQRIKQDGYIDVKNKRGEQQNVNNLSICLSFVVFNQHGLGKFFSCFVLLLPQTLSLC